MSQWVVDFAHVIFFVDEVKTGVLFTTRSASGGVFHLPTRVLLVLGQRARICLRLRVDEIKLDGSELIVCGSHRRVAYTIGFMQERKLDEVLSFVNDWRARQDSNLLPPA